MRWYWVSTKKTGIQALDRPRPLPPLSAKKPRSWSNKYVRHGTPTLLAAPEIASGQVVAQVQATPHLGQPPALPQGVVEAFPDNDLRMVFDDLNVHKNQAAQR
jgi:hypothetical protein